MHPYITYTTRVYTLLCPLYVQYSAIYTLYTNSYVFIHDNNNKVYADRYKLYLIIITHKLFFSPYTHN